MRKCDGDGWKDTWKQLGRRLDHLESLDNFRNDSILSPRIMEAESRKGKWKEACKDIPKEWCKDTLIGNPETFEFAGVEVSVSSLRNAYFLYRISELQSIHTFRKVLEVGPGYGGLAELVCRFDNVEEYYLIDHPTMYNLQEYYLKQLGVLDKCFFGKPTTQVDLIISTMSLGEMSKLEIVGYLQLFDAVLTPNTGLMYLVQHYKPAYDRIGLVEYPFSERWKLEFFPFVLPKFSECIGRLID